MVVDKEGTELNERAQRLLKTLVHRFIQDGEPVGSRTLAKESGLDVSPATVRNVLADLEDLGFVRSPHTSAGRVPTVRGYRFFVDTLLTVKPLSEHEIRALRRSLQLTGETNYQDIIDNASQLLSGVTRMAGIVMLPRREHVNIRQIEFLPLSGARVLAILVFEDDEVQNRVIDLPRRFSPSELQQASNYLSAEFAGKDLITVRRRLLADMVRARDHMNDLMRSAIDMAGHVFQEEEDEDYIIAGQSNLISFRELASDADKLRALFDAFTTKRDILHLLDEAVKADGVQIFIGEESGHEALEECSLVASPYAVNDRVVGVLGVIGPTRMAYDRVIPVVDVTAKLLSMALNYRE